MLSIGKLAVGQADYYLEQAHGPTTRTRAVSSGVEDYYLGGPEPAGEWIGAARRCSACAARSTATSCIACSPASTRRAGVPLGRWTASRVPGVRSDVLGAEERERAVRHRR